MRSSTAVEPVRLPAVALTHACTATPTVGSSKQYGIGEPDGVDEAVGVTDGLGDGAANVQLKTAPCPATEYTSITGSDRTTK